MAVVSVSADNTRVDDADAITGWSDIGGGQGSSAEASFPYQGTNLVNRKVTSSTGAGFYYDPTTDGGSAQDMTSATKPVWIVKAIVTDYGGLQTTNGLRVRIGSGTGAYYEYIIAGSNAKIAALDKYPAKGGLVLTAVDPNVAGYRDSTTGSPVLTAVDYFALVAAFSSSTAKSENVGLDAIDVGTGLTLVGGDGASTDGTFDDFLSNDEGTTNNRYGYVTETNGILNCFGMLTIGSATATEFSDSDSKLLFLDGYFDSGYSGITVDLQNASTAVTINNTIDSLGTDTVVDTRADFTVTGTSGSLTLGGTLTNFRNITLTSGVTVNSTADLEFKDMTTSTATITGATLRTNTASGVAAINDYSDTDLTGVNFIQAGSGHAIELTTTGTYNLDGIKFTGYGTTTGANDVPIYNNSGGFVTLNITNGGDTPAYRNGSGGIVVINNSVPVVVTVKDSSGTAIQGARVYLLTDSGGPAATGLTVLNGLSNASGIVQDLVYNYSSDQPVTGYIRKTSASPFYQQFNITGTITSSGFSLTATLVSDE